MNGARPVFVIDASTAAKWLPPFHAEPLEMQARELLHRWMLAELDLLVPDLMFVEVGNALWKTVRKGGCTHLQAATAMRILRDHNLTVIPSRTLLDAALAIAVKRNHTVYDSTYVALATNYGAQLITADEKLVNGLAGYYPVRWLGSL